MLARRWLATVGPGIALGRRRTRGAVPAASKGTRAVRRPDAGNLDRVADVIPGGCVGCLPFMSSSSSWTSESAWSTSATCPSGLSPVDCRRPMAGGTMSAAEAKPSRRSVPHSGELRLPRVIDAEDSGGRTDHAVPRLWALTKEQLNRPVAMPGRDRPGWRQPTAVPNLQSGAARRGSRRCTPTRLRHREQTLGRASRSVC